MSTFLFPHYAQLKRNDCGPTCLRIISKYYGKTLELGFIKSLCKFDDKGISVNNLNVVAEELGFQTMTFEVTYNQLIKKCVLPCIAFINNSHYVVVYKLTRNYVYVSDPSERRKTKYRHNYFSTVFIEPGTQVGTVICFVPQPKFYNTNSNGVRSNAPLAYLKTSLNYLALYKIQLVQLTIIMFLITILQGTTPFIFRTVLDVGVDKKNVDFINIMFVANMIIMLSTGLANMIKDLIIKHIGVRFGISIISNYLIKLLSMPLSFFDSLSSGEVLNRVKDHENIKTFILYHVTNLTYSVLTFFILGFILYLFNLSVFIIFFFFTIVYATWILCFKRVQEKLEWNTHSLYNRNNSFWIETINTSNEIKCNNLEIYHRKKWEEIQTDLYHEEINSSRIRNMQEVGGHIINGTKNIIITFFCAQAVVHGEMTFGIFISIQFMTGFLNMPIHQLINFIQAYPAAKHSFLRLNEIHTNVLSKNISECYKIPINGELQDIVLRKIYFRYADTTNYCLKNISLTITYGKITAIIGKSGSGKSSLIKLMLGLYEPNEGDLYLDNFMYKNIDLVRFREQCGVVLQDGKIFDDSVLMNIVLQEDKIDFTKLQEIEQMVELNDFINDLPLGYHTPLGMKGRKLSQGQKQRVLLARALYKEPKYLFLDEATSALDIFNETIILQRIIKYMKDKTLVIATHRINTIQNAGQIILLHNGMVTESGTHELLIKNKGVYNMMHSFNTQKTS